MRISKTSVFAALVLGLGALAGTLRAEELAPASVRMRDGLDLENFLWTDLTVHPVETADVRGEVRVQALLPGSMPVPKTPTLPLAGGIEVSFVFDLRAKEGRPESGRIRYTMETPPGGGDWLTPIRSNDILQDVRQSQRGTHQTIEATVDLNRGWSITLPVTTKMAAGPHGYTLALNGETLAEGSFTAEAVGTRERQAIERRATIFFFAHVAWPRFEAWIRNHGGRMPSTREFVRELENLPYFPDIDYEPHMRLPRYYSGIDDPAGTWLAREKEPSFDGRSVVIYLDGSIGLEAPSVREERRGRFDRGRFADD